MAAPIDTETNEKPSENTDINLHHDIERKHKVAGALFLSSAAGMSMFFGFGLTIAMAKRKDPTFFNKGLVGSKEIHESGASLAIRALGWGTFYAVSGFAMFCFGMTRLMGIHSMPEFTQKMQSIMPELPKSKNPGKSDFKDAEELIDYIVNDGKNEQER